MISPCVNVLRKLAQSFNDILGSDQGTRHASPDLANDIRTLMDSLHEHDVYTLKLGRVLDDDDEPAKDCIAIGLQNLTEGSKNPLSEYNDAFGHLQRQRKMTPVSLDQMPTPSNATTNTTQESESQITGLPAEEHILITCPTPTSPDNSDEEADFDMTDEPPTEAMMILEELMQGGDDETLPRPSAEDVALDMDLVMLEDYEGCVEEVSEDSGEDSEVESDETEEEDDFYV